MISGSKLFAKVEGVLLWEQFSNHWLLYLLLGFLLTLFLMFLFLPISLWLLSKAFSILRKVFSLVFQFLLVVIDLIFVVMIRVFQIKQLSPSLDLGGRQPTNSEERGRRSLLEGYRKRRKAIFYLLVMTSVFFFVYSDTNKWYEKYEPAQKVFHSIYHAVKEVGITVDPLDRDKDVQLPETEEVEILYVVLNEKADKGGAIREDGHLNAKVLATAFPTDELLYLDEKSDGVRLWYKVRNADGIEGWVSGAISDKVSSQEDVKPSPGKEL